MVPKNNDATTTDRRFLGRCSCKMQGTTAGGH